MQIQDIGRDKCIALLAHLRLGRIACSEAAQSYVVPFYFAYDDGCLYSFSTVGRKILWMRANPLVCVETDEIVSPEEWASIVVFGRYEELPETAQLKTEREFAHQLLQRNRVWWEPGYSKTIIKGSERALIPVYFRIRIVEITGHYSVPEPGERVGLKTSSFEETGKQSLREILADVLLEPFAK